MNAKSRENILNYKIWVNIFSPLQNVLIIKTTREANFLFKSGKKLGFLAQEIGREINTIGSKANDAAMQQTVVGMKDELEKIKEQLLNVL